MPILRKPKHENFTMVRNYFINDTRLKPDGKGVLLFMLSKPDDWNFKYENLMVGLGIGEKYLRSCIKQLEDLKYLKRSKCRGENGHYVWNYLPCLVLWLEYASPLLQASSFEQYGLLCCAQS